MEISLSAKVLDSGGVEYGHLVGGCLSSYDRRLTHVLLQQGRGPARLLPVVELSAGQQGIVWLRHSLEEVMELPPAAAPAHVSRVAARVQPAREGLKLPGLGASGDVTPAAVAATTTLRPDAPVRARDGVVGRLLRLGIRPRTGQITHLIVCVRHFFREREVRFDWNLVDRVEGNTIYIKSDKDEVHAMMS
jgi:hypothetical protein